MTAPVRASPDLVGVSSERLRLLLASLSRITSAVQDPSEVLRQIVEAAKDMVGARFAAMGVAAPNGRLRSFIHIGMDEETVAAIGDLPVGRGLLGQVVQTGQTIRLDRIADSEHSYGVPPEHPPVKAFLGVPVQRGGRVLGNLYLANKLLPDGSDEGTFDDEDESLVAALAGPAAMLLDVAAAFEREQELVAELRKADEAKEAFIHYIAHELKTPLITVRGALQMLRPESGVTGDARQTFEDIAFRQSDAMQKIINDLLELSNIEAGGSRVQLEPVGLRAALEDALASAPPPTDVNVLVDVGVDTRVIADARYIGRILTNLLVNAYVHGGPAITVTATRDDEQIHIDVADDGDGVPDSLIPTLFDRFTKGSGSHGTGLGLGLVKSLAERFGGAASYLTGPDGGALFRVSLPAPVVDPTHG